MTSAIPKHKSLPKLSAGFLLYNECEKPCGISAGLWNVWVEREGDAYLPVMADRTSISIFCICFFMDRPSSMSMST